MHKLLFILALSAISLAHPFQHPELQIAYAQGPIQSIFTFDGDTLITTRQPMVASKGQRTVLINGEDLLPGTGWTVRPITSGGF